MLSYPSPIHRRWHPFQPRPDLVKEVGRVRFAIPNGRLAVSPVFVLAAVLVLAILGAMALTGRPEVPLIALVGFLALCMPIAWLLRRERKKFRCDEIELDQDGWAVRKQGVAIGEGTWDHYFGYRIGAQSGSLFLSLIGIGGEVLLESVISSPNFRFRLKDQFINELNMWTPRGAVRDLAIPQESEAIRDRRQALLLCGAGFAIGVIPALLRGFGRAVNEELVGVGLFISVCSSVALFVALSRSTLTAKHAKIAAAAGPGELSTYMARPVNSAIPQFIGSLILPLEGVSVLTVVGLHYAPSLAMILPVCFVVSLFGCWRLAKTHLIICHDRWIVTDGSRQVEYDPQFATIKQCRRWYRPFTDLVQIVDGSHRSLLIDDDLTSSTVFRELLASQKRARIDSPQRADPTNSRTIRATEYLP